MIPKEKPNCCGEVVWVENVRDRGYWYCRGCKDEVVERPKSRFDIKLPDDTDDGFFGGGFAGF